MSEFWFDTRDGALLIGREAAIPRLNEAGSDVLPLAEILEAEEFPYGIHEYDKTEVEDWTKEDYINYGRWVLNIIKTEEELQPITRRHIVRLYQLGLGPRHTHMLEACQAKTWWELRREVGSPPGHDIGRFLEWTLQDFVNYARSLEAELKRKPTELDYAQASIKRDGPTPRIIDSRLPGGVGYLNENLGYPNIHNWTKDDYVSWGAKVIKANGGRTITSQFPKILSKRKRGPSDRTIYNHFGNWDNFITQAEEEFIQLEQEARTSRVSKLKHYTEMVKDGTLPTEFSNLDEEQLIQGAAKYLVVSKCAPDLSSYQKLVISQRQHTYVEALMNAKEGLTAGKIEIIAISLEVFDDIWPMKEDLSYLYISDEELGYKKPGNMKRFRRPLIKED